MTPMLSLVENKSVFANNQTAVVSFGWKFPQSSATDLPIS